MAFCLHETLKGQNWNRLFAILQLNHIHICVFFYVRPCVKFCVSVSYVKFCSHLRIFVRKGLRGVATPNKTNCKTLNHYFRNGVYEQASSSCSCPCHFEKQKKTRKQKNWKEKDLSEDNEQKSNWVWCFLNYLLTSLWWKY